MISGQTASFAEMVGCESSHSDKPYSVVAGTLKVVPWCMFCFLCQLKLHTSGGSVQCPRRIHTPRDGNVHGNGPG